MDDAQLSARSTLAYTAYGRACDNNDLAALRALACDDVEFRILGPVEKRGRGIEDFLDLFRAHEAGRVIRHVIYGVLAEQQGAEIHTTAHFEATLFGVHETRVTYGEYHNRFREGADGVLLIAQQVIEVQRHLHLPASVPAGPNRRSGSTSRRRP